MCPWTTQLRTRSRMIDLRCISPEICATTGLAPGRAKQAIVEGVIEAEEGLRVCDTRRHPGHEEALFRGPS